MPCLTFGCNNNPHPTPSFNLCATLGTDKTQSLLEGTREQGCPLFFSPKASEKQASRLPHSQHRDNWAEHMWEECTVLEHRKVILHYQHLFTNEFHPYTMDSSALSLLVLRISTIQQQLQDNRINTQNGVVWWGITTIFDIDSCHSDWLTVFSSNGSLCTYFIWSSEYKHWKRWNKGTQNTDNEDELQYKYTICFQTHNHRAWKLRLMTDPTAKTDWCSILVSFSFFLYPQWAGRRTVTLALLRAEQQAEWLGVNHSFVSLSWREVSGGPDRQGERWEDRALDSQ